MADFIARLGTGWTQTLVFGTPADRWRLDDYDVYAEFKRAAGGAVLAAISTLDGGITIVDAETRRADLHMAPAKVDAIGTGSAVFDLLFVNRTTGLRVRSEAHRLTIPAAITQAGG